MSKMAASSTTPSRKRVRLSSDETTDSQETDISSPKSTDSPESGGSTVANIPSNISKWTEREIQALSIITSYEEKITPLQLLEMFLPAERNPVLNHIEKFYTGYSAFHKYILDGEFSCLSRAVANDLRSKIYYESETFLNSKFVKELPSSELKELKPWIERCEGCGVRFGKILFNMILKRDFYEGTPSARITKPLCEYDFQFLFDAFASIFGLQSENWFEPVILPSSLTLSEANICGKADILYCEDIKDVSDKARKLQDIMRIVAVCEVKQHYCPFSDEVENRTLRGSGSLPSSINSKTLPPHISHALLGQHGGELLLYYHQSAVKEKDVIFGLIVQETKVTFTALQITEDQYDGIKTGKHRSTPPRLLVTKPYDFMKKEERAYLIRPFIELAMLQQVTE